MSQFNGLLQTTQFSISELYLITEFGTFDISMIFDELNLFDNLLTPVTSGSILVTDATNIKDKLKLNGNEFLKIIVDKGDDNPSFFKYEKLFRIYKITDDRNINFTSQSFVLHFISNDYLVSEQQKISQFYSGKYSDIVERILIDHIKVPNSLPQKGASGIQSITDSIELVDVVIPNLTPFDAIEWICRRALYNSLPQFVFFETQYGYTFAPLESLMSANAIASLNFNPKNIDKDVSGELLGIREFKILSTFQEVDNISSGAYAGTFFGFDTLTRTKKIKKINYVDDIFSKMAHLNKTPLLPDNTVTTKFDSREVYFPYESSRETNSYVKENDSIAATKINNTENYKFQRKSILYNLMQRRIQVNLPGNFGLVSGQVVNIFYPRYTTEVGNQYFDNTLSGRYLIIGVRHMIRYDQHETILEIATDSGK
uniref:Uncharacterized protein n=1 Tax=viral metagenome TaxID=1070528 RepID=A0A6C0JYF2_9ZZZZ